jgi:putative Mg2+ transporter-C (MgtC) family protein
MVLPHGVMILRILVSGLLGAVIGFERDRNKRPIGLRTHAIVAMASATFMVVSSQFAYFQDYADIEIRAVDGSRIASQVVSAIGFLAAGAIFRSGTNVQGLTTAAGLWLVTAIGLASGAGMYVEAVAATVLGVSALALLRFLEDKDGATDHRIQVTVGLEPEPERVVAMLRPLGVEVDRLGFVRDAEAGTTEVCCVARTPRNVPVGALLRVLSAEPGVRRVKIAPEGIGGEEPPITDPFSR